MPPAVTAGTGLDALTQCLEPFISHLATPLSDGFCREELRRAARSLRRAFLDGSDVEARQDMALASLCGGLALDNAKLGAVHSFCGPVRRAPRRRLRAPVAFCNGGQCARPAGTHPRRTGPDPYREATAILTGDAAAEVADGIAWIQAIAEELAVPGLADYGITQDHFTPVLALALALALAIPSNSMQGNPIGLTEAELTAVL